MLVAVTAKFLARLYPFPMFLGFLLFTDDLIKKPLSTYLLLQLCLHLGRLGGVRLGAAFAYVDVFGHIEEREAVRALRAPWVG